MFLVSRSLLCHFLNHFWPINAPLPRDHIPLLDLDCMLPTLRYLLEFWLIQACRTAQTGLQCEQFWPVGWKASGTRLNWGLAELCHSVSHCRWCDTRWWQPCCPCCSCSASRPASPSSATTASGTTRSSTRWDNLTKTVSLYTLSVVKPCPGRLVDFPLSRACRVSALRHTHTHNDASTGPWRCCEELLDV